MPAFSLPALRPPVAPIHGFTAIELMVVITIVAILAGLAMPDFGALVERYRLRRAGEDLTAAIYLARSEALRRGGNVTLRKAAASGCSNAEGRDWSCGWLVFADANNNGVLDPGEELIQVWPAPKGVDATLNVPSPSTYLNVNRWGRFHNMGTFSFNLKPTGKKDTAAALVLCMSSAGRLRSVRAGSLC